MLAFGAIRPVAGRRRLRRRATVIYIFVEYSDLAITLQVGGRIRNHRHY